MQVIERSFIMGLLERVDRKSTRLNSSHGYISYAVFCLKKNNIQPFKIVQIPDRIVPKKPLQDPIVTPPAAVSRSPSESVNLRIFVFLNVYVATASSVIV